VPKRFAVGAAVLSDEEEEVKQTSSVALEGNSSDALAKVLMELAEKVLKENTPRERKRKSVKKRESRA